MCLLQTYVKGDVQGNWAKPDLLGRACSAIAWLSAGDIPTMDNVRHVLCMLTACWGHLIAMADSEGGPLAIHSSSPVDVQQLCIMLHSMYKEPVHLAMCQQRECMST
jgi:hypothetical protein